MPTPKNTARRRNLQRIAAQMSSLLRNEDTPHHVQEGIEEHLSELLSVVPLSTFLDTDYPLLVITAEANGCDITEPNLVGQNLRFEESRAVH